MCLENVIYITKQEKVSIYYLGPFLGEFVRAVENVILVIILLPVKYLLKLSGSRNFYRLRMTSLTSTNVFTISCLSIEPPPGKFSSTSLYCTIRQLFVLFVDYSRTIRTIRRLFADYSYYSSTIRGLFVLFVDYSRTIRTIRRLFADYSHYSSTIRTIRFTILVLSIALLLTMQF